MQWTHYHQVVMASRYGSPPLWDFRPCRYKKISSYRTAIRDGQYTDALVQHPLPPWYWEKCGTMGCSILFKMVTEWIGLSATLATRRMGHDGSVCVLTVVEWEEEEWEVTIPPTCKFTHWSSLRVSSSYGCQGESLLALKQTTISKHTMQQDNIVETKCIRKENLHSSRVINVV
jgi:hypothetical protein